MLALLAWMALLSAGLGGSAGIASHPLAGKISGAGQHLQRQTGNAQATRTARRDHPALAAARHLAQEWHAGGIDDVDGPVPAVTARSDAKRADEPRASAPEPRLQPRYRAHPSRAPPVSA